VTGHRGPGGQNPIAYGPYGFLQSLVAGFIAGCVLFLIGDPIFSATPGIGDLPALLVCAGGAATITVAVAMAVNYQIGKAVLQQIELGRAAFAGAQPTPPAFDDLGNKLPAQTGWRAASQVQRREAVGRARSRPSTSDQAKGDTTFNSNVPRKSGARTFGVGDEHGHEFSTHARH
jgi:hypothetical protein